MVELDVPAMVHVSASCNPSFHALGAHYLNADTSVFMQLLEGDLMKNVYFDTCVYHQPGIDLLHRVVDVDNILFASEMLGAVRGVDPETGFSWDDTKRYVDAVPMTDEERDKVMEKNARRVYPRLDAQLTAAGR
jgi:4-oxalmesaconate hydratase